MICAICHSAPEFDKHVKRDTSGWISCRECGGEACPTHVGVRGLCSECAPEVVDESAAKRQVWLAVNRKANPRKVRL